MQKERRIMFGKKLVGMFAVAALAMGLSATSVDAAAVKHKSTVAVRGPNKAVKHTSKTAVHATPHNPNIGPVVTHSSRTTVRR